MIRQLLAIIGIFLVGSLVGYGLSPSNQSSSSPLRIDTTDNNGQDELYQETLAQKNTEIDSLDQEKLLLDQQLKGLNAELERLKSQTSDVTVASSLNEDMEEVTEETELSEEELEAISQERAERRTEFANRIRDGIAERWGEEWDKASPESQARISEIAGYQQELMDMRFAMRDAETDEDRAALEKASDAIRESLKTTLTTEQNAQLTSIAQRYGISDSEKIDAFIADTRAQLENPVFQMSGDRRRGGSFGGGSFSGGRDGGRGRGGDRERGGS